MRRDDLRDMLLEIGLDLLTEEGLARGTERLTFKRVFERAAEERGVRVTNASVIGRIWVDMEDYQSAVLAAALQNVDRSGVEVTVHAATAALSAADLTTVEGRRAATTEVIRVACAAHIEAVVQSRNVSLGMGLRGLSVARLPTETDSSTAASVRRAYEEYCRRWDFVLTHTFASVGIQVRPGLTIRQLSMLAISLAEGFVIWDRVEPTMTRDILVPSGPEGQKQEWLLYSLGVNALVRQFTEPVDRWPESPLPAGPPE